MGGGILQLAAFGSQDIMLTGNPQITFFRQLYKRHTGFAIESIEQAFNGDADFGRQVSATISRTGDLITHMYLEVTLPDLDLYSFTYADAPQSSQGNPSSAVRYVNSIGHALLKSVELEIGGFRVDKHVAEWMDVWHELSEPEERRLGLERMVGKYNPYDMADATEQRSSRRERTYYIPLLFFMNRHTGLALPLISLQFHETRVLFEFRNAIECIVHPTYTITGAKRGLTDPLSFKRARLFVDYIYLDTEERKRFAQIPHEMLIEQVQFLGDVPVAKAVPSQKVAINFSHPVKELIWTYTSKRHYDAKDIFNYDLDDDDRDVFTSVRLVLNGTDRFSERQGSYFRLVQPYQHHTRVPSKKIYSYSFALSPEEHQPSGTMNMSRIDQAYFIFNFEDPNPLPNPVTTLPPTPVPIDRGNIKIFAYSYNILRIASGLAGVAYSG